MNTRIQSWEVGIVFCLVAVLSGCQYTVQHTPENLPSVYGQVAQLMVSGPVSVINGQTSSEEEIVETRSRKLAVDYRKYSEAAAELLRDAIDKNGGSLSGDANKSMTVAIVNLTMTDSLTDVRMSMDATVRLGNGYLRGFNSSGAGRVSEAVDHALRQLVANILNDDTIRAYLER